ncbi:MAG TPA: branched-chain amino acid ABC transporter permease [Magnetospirillaceae bacterium]|nr:branched-chain amino acid ABC transporter permease [Magnetospirillaceae bacterium]
MLADQIVTGLLTGLIYGLMALGLSVIFGVMRIVNFAHGEMAVVAMYAAWAASRYLGLDPLLALLPIAALMFGAGYILQRGLIQPFVSRPDYMQFILLISVALILTNGALLVFGPEARGIQVDYAFDSYEIGPFLIDKVRLLAAGAALALTGLLLAFFRFTLTGKAIRAAADNRTGAQVIGLDIGKLYAVTFGIGTASLGAAGVLMALLNDAIPRLGPELTLLSFVIVIVGGLGSMAGALAGGVLIGVSEALAGTLLQPSLKSMFSFGLLVLILLFRPQGLLGDRS